VLVHAQTHAQTSRSFRLWGAWLSLMALLLLCMPPLVAAKDRVEELEGLRDAIQDSRGRVTEHEAGERAILERLEEVDRRLQSVSRNRKTARRDVDTARRRLGEIEPRLAVAKKEHSGTQKALAARAVALYRGGEIGPVRVIFSASSISELLSLRNFSICSDFVFRTNAFCFAMSSPLMSISFL
jgi:septal ring factor EnvC (AmiA/AmiB activator)